MGHVARRAEGDEGIPALTPYAGILVNPDVASDILPLLRTFLLPILEEARRGTQELDARRMAAGGAMAMTALTFERRTARGCQTPATAPLSLRAA